MPISIPFLWWLIVPAASILALLFAYIFYRQIMRASPGDEQMQQIAAYVREGAYAYLRRQYKVVFIFLLIVAGLLALLVGFQGCSETDSITSPEESNTVTAFNLREAFAIQDQATPALMATPDVIGVATTIGADGQ